MDLISEGEQYLLNVYNRIPLQIVKGSGVWLCDASGKKYLDLISGIAVNALGYNHAGINRAIRGQLKKNLHLSNFFLQDVQVLLAKELLKLTPFSKVFFSNSGAESIEGLLKVVKKWGNENNKSDIIAFSGSFHGRTLGAVSITGQEKYNKNFHPLLNHVKISPFNDSDALRKNISEKTCAIFFEGISGEGGIRFISDEMLQTIDELRKKYGFLVIIDEIQTGIGRTGKFFNFENYTLIPDGIATAKALGGGLPLGAFLLSEKLAHVFELGEHGTTFGGNPLACAAGLAVIIEIKQQGFLKRVTENGNYFLKKLNALRKKYPHIISEIRGRGLFIGVELFEDGREIVTKARNKGILLNITAAYRVLRIIPPLIINKTHINKFINVFDDILYEMN